MLSFDRSRGVSSAAPRRAIVRFALAVLCAGYAGAVAPLAAQTPAGTAAETVLRAGDLVRITVWEEPLLSGEFQVSAQGSLQHPLYRELTVVGMPVAQVEARLREFLVRYREDPRFTFEPLYPVVVSGEVREPGVQNLGPDISIARAATLAGPTELARFDRVRLVRDGQTVLVDLADPNSEWARAPVRSGDRIVVERRLSLFRDVVVPSSAVVASVSSVIGLILFLSGL